MASWIGEIRENNKMRLAAVVWALSLVVGGAAGGLIIWVMRELQ